MNFNIILEACLLNVELQNKKHIKHCYLRIIDKNSLQIKANRYFSIDDAKALIIRKKSWILENIKNIEDKTLEDGVFLFLGEKKLLNDYKIKNLDNFYKREIWKQGMVIC